MRNIRQKNSDVLLGPFRGVLAIKICSLHGKFYKNGILSPKLTSRYSLSNIIAQKVFLTQNDKFYPMKTKYHACLIQCY